ncbi:MAG: ATP-dependent RNA helicase, partial [Spirochaetia bacterium]|nr:ATP-dependent RNA helicase [Spirochaetia bacterium]
MRAALPIDVIREKILASLEAEPFLILSAPTGSGKSTRVPQFLFESGKFPGTIYILEPRVLAARLLAERVASELGVRLGEEVGYRTRHDTKCSPQTRVVFVTEGLFFRLLKDNPKLNGISAVLLDEFHERNIDSDLVLSYLKEAVPANGGKTRVVVMSATLETEGLKKFLESPHLETGGKLFPVDIEHFPAPGGRTDVEMWDHAALAVRRILENEKPGSAGDGLVFMPGMHEIRKTIQAIENMKLPEPVTCLALHGEMNPDEQRQVLGKTPRRKIIVATNVAETSLTIEGITWVVDGGWARVARFHPGKNIDLLVLERISLSSATQRAGRAGRMAPGKCVRLWSQAEELRFSKTTDPEIRRVDLAETVLQAKSLGQTDLEKFPWFEAPEKKSLDQAEHLLKLLGALQGNGELTEMGERMGRLPMSPRLSRFAIEAEKRNALGEALLWAAMLSEPSFLIRGRYKPERGSRFRSDFSYLSELLHKASLENFRFDFLDREGIHGVRARRVLKTFQLYARIFENRRNRENEEDADLEIDAAEEKELADLEASLIRSLLPAFPDRIAVKDHDASSALELSGKRRGRLSDTTHVRSSRVVIVSEMIEIQTRGSQDTIFDLLSALEPKWILEAFP